MQQNTLRVISLTVILLSVFFVIIVAYVFSSAYLPLMNTKYLNYEYLAPDKDKDFIVHISAETTPLPEFIKIIIQKAFYDRNVVFSNTKPPHLAVFSIWEENWKILNTHHAPYIIFSEEKHSIPPLRAKKTSPHPFLEINSFKPKNYKHLYFPFVGWNEITPERKYKNTNRQKFLAYISSRCFQHRERFFRLILQKNGNADALGTCSNNHPIAPTTNYDSRWLDLPEIYSQYNFAVAMENDDTEGYITEKMLTVFNGGAIPIFWGDSKTAKKLFNKKAYIDVKDFKNPEEAASFIINLSTDPKRIKEMQQEPVFNNNKIPDLIDLKNKDNPLIAKAAKQIRAEYFKTLEENSKKTLKAKWFYPSKGKTS